mmetsp:Transcript_38422/g.81974  ORF Transcript_38422/g.81974 Transcript_38422/m.81974 type:complete len:206 (+) Transcript_38422:408-1025(+)
MLTSAAPAAVRTSATPVLDQVVQLLQLRLALVVLVDVVLLQRHSRVRLVHIHGERVPHALHRQVLPHRLELGAVPVIVPIPSVVDLPPLVVGALEVGEVSFQDRLGSHQLGARGGGEAEVLLLKLLAGPLNCHFLVVLIVQLLTRSADGGLAHVFVRSEVGGSHVGGDTLMAPEAVGAFRQAALIGIKPTFLARRRRRLLLRYFL